MGSEFRGRQAERWREQDSLRLGVEKRRWTDDTLNMLYEFTSK
jgi:hypothetical protein